MFTALAMIVCFAVLASILRPLARNSAGISAHQGMGPDAQSDIALYQAQLAEIERDLARGVLGPEEAAQTRAEIGRRLLSADAEALRQHSSAGQSIRPAPWLAVFLAASLVVTGVLGYLWLGAPGYRDYGRAQRLAQSEAFLAERPAQAEAELTQPATGSEQVSQDYLDIVAELRKVTASRPEDLRGQELLARHEAALGNYAAAAKAQAQVIKLKGAEASTEDRFREAELMIYAARGYVSPEAETRLRAVLAQDPQYPGARFYVGLLLDQASRPDLSFGIWRDLIETQPGNPYARRARELVMLAADRAGMRYEPPTLPINAGPTQDQIADAEEMDPEARQEMITGMVEGLAARLASDGGTADDWSRLISSLVVLGQTERARTILAEAQTRFASRPDDLELINTTAKRAGIR